MLAENGSGDRAVRASLRRVCYVRLMRAFDHLPASLDRQTCERARYARDAAYDGVFFIGVTSTRIYCRPVCRVRQPRSENVRYYGSATAAETAGFRPCLRCRPEAAQRSPAWNGTAATVARALRLIEEGALDAIGVEAFAARLGIGARHLAQLFRDQLGATPTAVARTARVQRAKRLIDTTTLSMTQVAAEAGFGSLRSFNAAFTEVYRCPPTALRRRNSASVPHRLAPVASDACPGGAGGPP